MRELEELTMDQLRGLDNLNRPYRVLVIEDEAGTRTLITRILRAAQYKICDEASDGKMGVAKYKMNRPDIVTMDVKMPHFNGYQALKEIKKFDPNAVVLMLTHEASKDTVFKILKAGAADYLLKPVNRRKLLAKLKKVRRAQVQSRYITSEEVDYSDKMEALKEKYDSLNEEQLNHMEGEKTEDNIHLDDLENENIEEQVEPQSKDSVSSEAVKEEDVSSDQAQ